MRQCGCGRFMHFLVIRHDLWPSYPPNSRSARCVRGLSRFAESLACWRPHVTPYASAHPWEDFAETWAHYFHMVDTLETATAFGLRLRPEIATQAGLEVVIDFDPHLAHMDRIINRLAPADVCREFNQSEHGTARSLPVRAVPGGHFETGFRALPNPRCSMPQQGSVNARSKPSRTASAKRRTITLAHLACKSQPVREQGLAQARTRARQTAVH